MSLPQETAVTGRAVAKLEAHSGPITGIVPKTVEEAFRMAELIVASQTAPDALKGNASGVCVVMMKGLEIGLPPMAALETIGIINGKAALFGDAIPALLWGAGFDIDEHYEHEDDLLKLVAHCTITRPGGKKYSSTYSVQDAIKSGLYNPKVTDSTKPWQKYTKRMTRMRCRIWLARDVASDVLKGMPLYEEQRDIELDKTEYNEVPAAAKPVIPAPPKRRKAVVESVEDQPSTVTLAHADQETAELRAAAGVY